MKNIVCFVLALCMLSSAAVSAETEPEASTIQLQILATSDIHGKFVPFDYAVNAESPDGSLAQIATFIKEVRNENTLLIDCGDIIQGNFADLFLQDERHPMMTGLNMLDYDIWVAGNHEFNFGVEPFLRAVSQFEGEFLCGNVLHSDGSALGKDYVIQEVAGLKIAVIGMVTPHITRWDARYLKDYVVLDPVVRTRQIIDEIKDEVDVIIAAQHMGRENEYDVPNTGVYDLADACPEIDLIIAAHDHEQVHDDVRNGVLIVENANGGATVIQAQLTVEKDEQGKGRVVHAQASCVPMAGYAPDPEIIAALSEADKRAKANALVQIGRLLNGPLAPENEIAGIPQSRLEPTALINLINSVQLHYSGAQVSATALFADEANLTGEVIRNCDAALIYPYDNTLCMVEISGAQLKRYMEWSARYYNQYREGDLTISFNPNIRGYNYDMLMGVNYNINIAKPEGQRIENLTWPDGRPVQDDETILLALNNYRVSTQLCTYGEIFQEGEELPKVLETGIRGDIGGVREMIGKYIKDVENGVIDANEYAGLSSWQIVGNDWDDQLHAQAVQLINEGKLSVKNSENNRSVNIESITVEDLP